MANPLPLVALAGDDLGLIADWAMTNEDVDYPATNLLNGDPAHVAKSTTTTTTITATVPSASIVAAALINTNAETATVEGVSVTIPAVDYDGQRVHGWLDRRTVPLGPTTAFDIALSRSSGPVWIGHIALLVDIHALNLRYGFERGRRRPGDIRFPTRLGSIVRESADIRTNWARGVANLEEDEALHKALESSARGAMHSFVFIPDEATNEAWLVTHAENDFRIAIPNITLREVAFAFEELSGGPPNG